MVENDGLIPKPVGEAGRRVGGRGYNIEDALKWPEKDTESMKVNLLAIIEMVLLKYCRNTSKTSPSNTLTSASPLRARTTTPYWLLWML